MNTFQGQEGLAAEDQFKENHWHCSKTRREINIPAKQVSQLKFIYRIKAITSGPTFGMGLKAEEKLEGR